MKTKTEKQKKMKTTIKQITAGTFIALLLMVGNVKAAETNASILESNETNLQLEDWMTDETIWNTISFKMAEYGQEMEEALIIESWMTNADLWNLSYFNETETSLELENWMTDEEVWDKDIQFAEATLTVEDWMINNEFWQ